MATDPADWRLQTPAGVPYRFVSLEGNSSYSGSGVSVVVLIEAVRLFDFLAELFPESAFVGGVIIPQPGIQLAGVPNLITENVTFKSHDTGLPVDPFEFDTDADPKTYHGILELTVDYTNDFQIAGDNPLTFLEISCQSTTEVLTLPTSNHSKWKLRDGSNFPPDPNIKSPVLPVIKAIPIREWSLKWPRLNFIFFWNFVKPRLDAAEGRVNSTLFAGIPGSPAETLLMSSFNYSASFDQFRQNVTVFVPPPPVPPLPDPPIVDFTPNLPTSVSLDIKIIEKQFVDVDGIIRGHNDFWVPGEGWRRLLPDGVNPVYDSIDFNLVFA